MNPPEVQRLLLAHLGLRVGPEVAAYVLRRLTQAGDALRELPVIGGEARTGIPVRMNIELARLQQGPT